MIKCDKSKIEITGTIDVLMAEFSCIANRFNELLAEKFGRNEAERLVREAVERGLLTDEQIEEKIEKELNQAKGLIDALVEAILGKEGK